MTHTVGISSPAIQIVDSTSTQQAQIFPITPSVHLRGKDWETIKGQVTVLIPGVTVAIFTASVQAQLIAISYQDNSTRLKTAANVLGFAGTLLDVSAACLGLMASTALQRHVDYVEKQLDAIEDASREQLTDIPRILRESRVSVPRELYRRLREKVNARLAVLDGADPGVGDDSDGQWDIPTEGPGLDIQAVPAALKQIQHVMTNGDIASGALLIGVLCFFGSVICLAVATQPRAVWIVAAVITIGILVAAVWGSLAVLPSVLIHLGIKLPAFLDL